MLQISPCHTYYQKRCLYHNVNYRPVSNFCFIAKILEKHVLSQVFSYLNSHNCYNTFQSVFRPGHCNETGLLKVVNDLFISLDKDNMSVLALFDSSLAIDTINHSILVHHLHTDFGYTDTILQWFSSYLTDRTQYVSLSNYCSAFLLCSQVFIRVQFLTLFCSPCILGFLLSCTIHLLMAYNYRCLLPLTKYLSYFTLCSHV